MAEHLIIVGADGSDLSAAALRWAVDHARHIDADVLALTAFDIPMTVLLVPSYTDEDYARDAAEASATTLQKAFGGTPPTDVHVTSEVIQERPALALTGVAETRGADLLVLGSHGQGELPGLHLGSVVGYCAHHAPCPVLIVRAKGTGR
jgi:nucleotide-binding universal stress UspA family protein